MDRWLFLTARLLVLGLPLQVAHAQSGPAGSEGAGRAGSEQSYPTKAVRIVVGLAPGGGADMIARIVAQKLSESLGRSFVVENRPGAGGSIAPAYVANSPPDGYTLLLVVSGFSAYPALYPNLPYDPIKNFAPITLVSQAPFILVVHPSLPVKRVKELIALAKARPGELDVGSSGIGGSGHLAGELFQSMAGIKLSHIPYKGSGQSLVALVAGNVHLVFSSIMASVSHVKSGRLRALGVTGAKRSPIMPDTPTISESDVHGYEATNWYGLVAPKGTPVAILSKLNAEIVNLVRMPDVASRLAAEGGEPVGSTPDQFTRHLMTEIVRNRKVIKDAGVRLD